ncbi:MAG TPA: YdiU family protein, partial [Phenylobacterium sp.]|nr:YdiU family protein [Phenylobacterium sp.]
MPVSPAYRPDPRLPGLGPEFADPVAAADFPQTLLRFRNDRAAATVGLDALTDAEWVAHFGRFQPLPGNIETPLAQRYHGHQFRVYNPDLGDGRGFTFAQLREVGSDRLLDLGTKGSGTTPWSRGGDGRLTLKGGMREVLATAMLEALGVPTSKSFSLIETGEALERGDEPSPTRSAVLTRLSHSHIRFGTFQRQAFLEQPQEIVRLVDYVIETYYPELDNAPDRPSALLTAVVEQAGALAASWMAAGFVHGVLNTDNMNITGESFDYGPYRFLPHNDPNFVAAYFDQQGLYSFGRQPEAVFWNLQNLGGCLSMVAEQQALVDALNGFADAYRGGLAGAMLKRLGLKSRGRELDAGLVNAAFTALAAGGERLRWEPFFFDWFCGDVGRAMASPRGDVYGGQPFADFRRRVAETEPDRPGRLL